MPTNGDTNGTKDLNGGAKHVVYSAPPDRLYSLTNSSSITALISLASRTIEKSSYPYCKAVVNNIPIYDLASPNLAEATTLPALQNEWHSILHTGPGIFVLKRFYSSAAHPTIDSANRAFDNVIATEATGSKGDHFAASSANSRIWNSLQKHALADPNSFLKYYSNPWLRHVSECWLGPAYTITAQVNIVRPGGKPQMPHRDYHLGFQTAEQAAQWPKTMHNVSQFLTLQGAVAHSNMPLESGPTRFLPFSQLLEDGYLTWRNEDVKSYFADKWVSAPLEKGDAVFFNPALIHAAGENQTVPGPNGIDRSANLLQISSAFGKTMEKIDHDAMVIACWEELTRAVRDGELSELEAGCAVQSMTDGYPFPTNLDRRPPAPGGMAPESQTEIVLRCLEEGRSKVEMIDVLRQLREDSSA